MCACELKSKRNEKHAFESLYFFKYKFELGWETLIQHYEVLGDLNF